MKVANFMLGDLLDSDRGPLPGGTFPLI